MVTNDTDTETLKCQITRLILILRLHNDSDTDTETLGPNIMILRLYRDETLWYSNFSPQAYFDNLKQITFHSFYP